MRTPPLADRRGGLIAFPSEATATLTATATATMTARAAATGEDGGEGDGGDDGDVSDGDRDGRGDDDGDSSDDDNQTVRTRDGRGCATRDIDGRSVVTRTVQAARRHGKILEGAVPPFQPRPLPRMSWGTLDALN